MNLMQYIDRGGVIVYILIFLNVIGLSIMLWKIFVLVYTNKNKQTFIATLVQKIKQQNDETNTHKIQSLIDNEIKKLETGLNTIKIIASIAPLLGLLGTVVGILNAFDSISLSGLGDPAIFSSGISIALITTVAGLIVAIPHYIGYNYFIGSIDKFEITISHEVYGSL
jgi:biopolymer transport protein ExbB